MKIIERIIQICGLILISPFLYLLGVPIIFFGVLGFMFGETLFGESETLKMFFGFIGMLVGCLFYVPLVFLN